MIEEEDFKWYIVHVLSGSEKKIVQAIKDQAEKKKVSEFFDQLIIPVEQVLEIRRGQKVNSEKKVLPGYLLIKMKLTDVTWHIVKNISKVTGFLGHNGKPKSVSDSEIKNIFQQIEESASLSKHLVFFEIGESVKIIDGPFESFVGIVEGIDKEKSRLTISVSIFGRATPVELEYIQVTKV